MNPISSDIFGRLDWLTKRIKHIYGRLTKIEQSGAGSYKVYSALLYQNGGDDVNAIDTGTLIIGKTYRFNNDSPGMDFTNVGANTTVYVNGYSFVATGTTPNSWGSLENTGNATLQFNNGAPIVTVLENTLGQEITWTYIGDGSYGANSPSNTFTTDKTFVMIGSQDASISGGPFWAQYSTEQGEGSILFQSLDPTSITSGNNWYARTPIEIRVYN
jgi:hypothetical protein